MPELQARLLCALGFNHQRVANVPQHPPPSTAGIREAIEARGATLRYLPQSPNPNPIEMPFSKLSATNQTNAD
jgi:hypothetical protein